MASLNINKVTLGGRLTSDPELKQTPQGVSVTTFSIAVKRRGKEAQTDFINCVSWRATAELICKHFKKGNSIVIDGEIQTRTWQDANNQKRYATEVIVSDFYFVESKDEPAFKVDAPKFEEVQDNSDLPF